LLVVSFELTDFFIKRLDLLAIAILRPKLNLALGFGVDLLPYLSFFFNQISCDALLNISGFPADADVGPAGRRWQE